MQVSIIAAIKCWPVRGAGSLKATFRAPNRTITQPIKPLISPRQAREIGVYSAALDRQAASGMPGAFNNALYSARI
jgi:hypothetical protein